LKKKIYNKNGHKPKLFYLKIQTKMNKDAISRLLKDIREIVTKPEPGIYYKHSELDMSVGYAMIIGPKDSLYSGGYYFYKFKFPDDYPHTPPVVEFLTNDGVTRMHPNMYKTKKVCISILNTWRGDQWSGCQSIKSVLLSLMSLLDDKPLLHEPGITEKNVDYDAYHKIIQFKNYNFCMLGLLKSFEEFTKIVVSIEHYEYFYELMCDIFYSTFSFHANKIQSLFTEYPEAHVIKTSAVYNMAICVDYAAVVHAFNECLHAVNLKKKTPQYATIGNN